MERIQYIAGCRGGEKCKYMCRRGRGKQVGMPDAQRVGLGELRGRVRLALEASHFSHDCNEWQAITLEVCFHDKLMTRAPASVTSAAITRSLCRQYGIMIVGQVYRCLKFPTYQHSLTDKITSRYLPDHVWAGNNPDCLYDLKERQARAFGRMVPAKRTTQPFKTRYTHERSHGRYHNSSCTV